MLAGMEQTEVIIHIADYVRIRIDEDTHIRVFHGDLSQHPFIWRRTILRPQSILTAIGWGLVRWSAS